MTQNPFYQPLIDELVFISMEKEHLCCLYKGLLIEDNGDTYHTYFHVKTGKSYISKEQVALSLVEAQTLYN